MSTTVFTSTFTPGAVDFDFKWQNTGGDTGPVDSIVAVTETDSIGQVNGLVLVPGGFQVMTYLSNPYPTDYDTAISQASGLLRLDPTKSYTLTITEN